MSDDPSRPPSEEEEPHSSPFPESSLMGSDDPAPEKPDADADPGVPPGDPPYGQPQSPGFQGEPTAQADPPPATDPISDPPAPPSEPPPSLGERWAAPAPPAPAPAPRPQAPSPPGPGTPPAGSGYSSGDPLGGSATPGFSHGDPLGTAPGTPSYPQGYTSPPPPGAGGTFTGHAPAPAPGGGTLVLSGWWRRVGAAIIDGLIIGVVALAIMAPLGLGVFAVDENDTAGVLALIGAFFAALLVVAVVALAYAPLMMGKTNGKTVGRMVTGIRVVRANGQPMTFGYAALREIAVKVLLINAVAGSFTLGLAGLLDVLWPLWDDENRALHDFVVDTRTIVD